MTIPADAQYYIIKDDETDWSEFGIEDGDNVYFNQLKIFGVGLVPVELQTFEVK